MTAYRVYVHLAANEYGNALMREVADTYAQSCDKRPLIVHVDEHGGWFLSYLYGVPNIEDGTICGTANDGASLAPAVVAFGKSIARIEPLGDIRR